ncbi:MAG: DUF5998 family protein [Nitriliruptoraceae bacterium]
MTEWRTHLQALDQGQRGWGCVDQVEQLLVEEDVRHVAAGIERDVCDEGHMHTDVTLGLLTPTRLLHVVASDAQHVTEEHETGLQCDVSVLPLTAIDDVSVSCWDDAGHPVTELVVPRGGAGWRAIGDLHDCGDPSCEIPPGSIQLEARNIGMSFLATGEDAGELLRFAAQLSRVIGPGSA